MIPLTDYDYSEVAVRVVTIYPESLGAQPASCRWGLVKSSHWSSRPRTLATLSPRSKYVGSRHWSWKSSSSTAALHCVICVICIICVICVWQKSLVKYGPSKSHALKYGQPFAAYFGASGPVVPGHHRSRLTVPAVDQLSRWRFLDDKNMTKRSVSILSSQSLLISSDFKWFQDRRPGAPLKSNASSSPIGVSLSSRCRWNGGHSGAICIHLLCLQTFGWWKKKWILGGQQHKASRSYICIHLHLNASTYQMLWNPSLDCYMHWIVTSASSGFKNGRLNRSKHLCVRAVHMDTLNLLFAETNISVRWHYLEAGLWFCDVEFHFAFCHDSNCTGPLNQTPAVWGKVAMWASCNFWRVCPTSKLWMFGMKKNWHRLFQIPEKKHSDSMIQFWRLSLPSPYWDSMIYIYSDFHKWGYPFIAGCFWENPIKSPTEIVGWLSCRADPSTMAPPSLAPNPRGRLLLFRSLARGPQVDQTWDQVDETWIIW